MAQFADGKTRGLLGNNAAGVGGAGGKRVNIAVEDTEATGSIRAEGPRHLP